MFIDTATEGALMGKSIEAAKALLEEMAYNNYHLSSKRATMKKSSGMYRVNVVDLLASKVDALAQRFDRLQSPSMGSSSCMMYKVGAICEIRGI